MAGWSSRVALPPRAAEDVEVLVKMADKASALIESVKQQRHASRVEDIIQPAAENSKMEYRTAYQILNTLENIYLIIEEVGDADSALSEMAKSLSPDLATKLEAKKSVLLAALDAYDRDNPFTIAFKAQRLAYLRDRLLYDCEVITDARPVYDSKGEKILEFIITHSLVATYQSAGQRKSIHIAMDAKDVLKLHKACERAIVKAKTLKTELGEKSKWLIEVLRDDEDDNNGDRS